MHCMLPLGDHKVHTHSYIQEHECTNAINGSAVNVSVTLHNHFVDNYTQPSHSNWTSVNCCHVPSLYGPSIT